MTPRMQIVWYVLEGSTDAGDDRIANICRRLITADRLGWIKYHNRDDYRLICEFYNMLRESVTQ